MTNTTRHINYLSTSQSLTAFAKKVSGWQMAEKNRNRYLSQIATRREALKK